jgi:hypothetical protein
MCVSSDALIFAPDFHAFSALYFWQLRNFGYGNELEMEYVSNPSTSLNFS